jgi:hypothetical protein
MSTEERMWFKVQHCFHVIWMPISKFWYAITEHKASNMHVSKDLWTVFNKLGKCLILKFWNPRPVFLNFTGKIKSVHSLSFTLSVEVQKILCVWLLKIDKFSMKIMNFEIKYQFTQNICFEWDLWTIENCLYGFWKDELSIFKHFMLR